MIAKTRDGVRSGVVAIPAVLGARLVVDFAVVVRVLGSLEKIFHQIHGVVEEIVVGLTDVDVQLAVELWSKLGPVALEDVAQVVILAPVGRDCRIDLSG